MEYAFSQSQSPRCSWLDELQDESDLECELRLHFGEGLTRAQIAERLETSERSMKRDLIKTYGRLRIALESDAAEYLELRGWPE